MPLATGAGDQVSPAISDGTVVYQDLGIPGGWLMRRDIGSAAGEAIAGPGISAGPALDMGVFAWQALDNSACMKSFAGDLDKCIMLPAVAEDMVFAGDKAVTSHGGKVIRLVNFGTGRSKMLDSSTSAGNRYDPAIDGDRVVWVKERGYAGKYYEPLIVDYDIASDTSVYLTAFGGGASSTGESLYQREAPTVSNGDVLYQQRIREPGEQWDIYRASAETYGVPVVEAPGDQINPSLEGDLLVYQDNRGGYLDEHGVWVGEWDLYLRDMVTGIEIPLCTASGDQINPRINGNTIVWEDNRGGDWDVYAAVLAGGQVGDPDMTVRVDDVLWQDYSDYTARMLTVKYRFDNVGTGTAHSFSLRQVDTIPAEVGVAGLPDVVSALPAGQASVLDVYYHVPQGVMLFKTALFASCTDGAGNETWYPEQPAALL
jgi:beta propeller repeat protein